MNWPRTLASLCRSGPAECPALALRTAERQYVYALGDGNRTRVFSLGIRSGEYGQVCSGLLGVATCINTCG
jgi:hypothetical protein